MAAIRKACPQVFAIFLTAALALPLQAGKASPIPAAQAGDQTFTVQENVLYASVNGTDLRLDVYEPAPRDSSTRPAVILIHGGGWNSLDKGTMRGMGGFLARSGFVAFAVDYRLHQGKQNQWPAQLDDVQRAVRWVRAHAGQYNVNPQRIGAFGHSAGAQLAALLGMEDTRDNSDSALAAYSSKVQAVVDVSGPTDFTQDDPNDEFLSNFLGGSFAKDPNAWRDASPALHVVKDDAPFLIFHGTQDDGIPMSQPQELYDKLKAVGVPVSFLKVNDGHTFRTPEARRELAVESQAFFNRYLVVGD